MNPNEYQANTPYSSYHGSFVSSVKIIYTEECPQTQSRLRAGGRDLNAQTHAVSGAIASVFGLRWSVAIATGIEARLAV